MILEPQRKPWQRVDVFDRAALGFALNARPATSQDEAPVGAIENIRF